MTPLGGSSSGRHVEIHRRPTRGPRRRRRRSGAQPRAVGRADRRGTSEPYVPRNPLKATAEPPSPHPRKGTRPRQLRRPADRLVETHDQPAARATLSRGKGINRAVRSQRSTASDRPRVMRSRKRGRPSSSSTGISFSYNSRATESWADVDDVDFGQEVFKLFEHRQRLLARTATGLGVQRGLLKRTPGSRVGRRHRAGR